MVLRPKSNLAGQEYRHRLYEVLLLDSKTPPTDTARPCKYLPMFSTESMEEEPWEQVLTEVLKITGGIKGVVHVAMLCTLITYSDCHSVLEDVTAVHWNFYRSTLLI